MSKQWQVIDENGELLDEDDNSSIGSDWSFVRLNSEQESADRPRSVSGDASSLYHSAGDRRPDCRFRSVERERDASLPNSMDPPIQDDPTALPSATSVRAVTRSRSTTTGLLRSGGATSGSTLCGFKKSSSPNAAMPRKVACRWNSAVHANRRHHQRNTLNVDQTHAKCLRRGAQVSQAFQRKQVHLAAGGQIIK